MGLQFLCASNEKYRFYYLLLNKTDSFGNLFSAPRNPLPTDRRAVALKVLIDNALLDYEKGGNFQTKYINYDLQQYPTMPNRALKGFDIVTQAGAFYYLITPLFGFLFIQNEIVREKELKLRQGINMRQCRPKRIWSQPLQLLVLVGHCLHLLLCHYCSLHHFVWPGLQSGTVPTDTLRNTFHPVLRVLFGNASTFVFHCDIGAEPEDSQQYKLRFRPVCYCRGRFLG